MHVRSAFNHPVRDVMLTISAALLLHALLIVVSPAEEQPALIGAFLGFLVPMAAVAHILHRPDARIGPGDWVTLARTVLIGLTFAAMAMSLQGQCSIRSTGIVIISVVAVVLDGIDGHVARALGTASTSGARFDLETDAAFTLGLSVAVGSILGWWVVMIGAMRYLYLAVSWRVPALRRPLPASRLRKVIGVTQTLVLCAALIPFIPAAIAWWSVAAALAALTWSFGRDARQQLGPLVGNHH